MKQRLAEVLHPFYQGKYYPLLVSLLVFVGHSTGWDILFFEIMVATFVVGCLIEKDLRFALPTVFGVIFLVTPEHSPNVPSYSDYYLQPLPLTFLIIGFGAILCGGVIFAIRNRRNTNPVPLKGSFLGLAILSAALCLNGALSPAYTVQNLLFALSFPIILVGLYWLFARYVHFDRAAFDYFMYCLVLAGMQIVCQLLLAYATTVQFVDGDIVKESVVLGWAVWTSLGGMQAFLMPACFYFAATHPRGYLFYAMGLLQFLGVLLSQSRGAMLFGAITLVLCMALVCFFGKNKRINRIISVSIIAVGLCGVLVLWNKLLPMLQNVFANGLGDNGRFDLWRLGISQFFKHPIFGAGFYDSGIVQDWLIEVYPYFYHNTLVQMLGSCGVVGIAAYLYHRVSTVRLTFRKPNLYKSTLALCIFTLMAFCLLDVIFFITYPLLFYTLMILFMEKSRDIES
ncbi:MAG: O-antigen ligase family protein [Clostridia bacterium]|nr:O-antigen ligase family protein [Clostridia bacterium]